MRVFFKTREEGVACGRTLKGGVSKMCAGACKGGGGVKKGPKTACVLNVWPLTSECYKGCEVYCTYYLLIVWVFQNEFVQLVKIRLVGSECN